VGDGSDTRLLVPASSSRSVDFFIHTQDAAASQYKFMVDLHATDTQAGIRDQAEITVDVRAPVVSLSMREIASDPFTLAKTIRITNDGDVITDLLLNLDAGLAMASMDPSVRHGHLNYGETLDVVVSPVLKMGFSGISGMLAALVSGQTLQSIPLNFMLPVGQSLQSFPLDTVVRELMPSAEEYYANFYAEVLNVVDSTTNSVVDMNIYLKDGSGPIHLQYSRAPVAYTPTQAELDSGDSLFNVKVNSTLNQGVLTMRVSAIGYIGGNEEVIGAISGAKDIFGKFGEVMAIYDTYKSYKGHQAQADAAQASGNKYIQNAREAQAIFDIGGYLAGKSSVFGSAATVPLSVGSKIIDKVINIQLKKEAQMCRFVPDLCMGSPYVRSNHGGDFYCTNKPDTTSSIGGPLGLSPND
ncbi:MAG: hypothetical protein Q9M23_08605, partial [Mariprofundaceae bacterium]|nr:hypothetical protein [Mariprofundaceae bacterium]